MATIDGTTLPNTDGYQDFTGTPLIENENRITGIGPSGPSMSFTYENDEAPEIIPYVLPNAFVGSGYSYSLAAYGGEAPVLWTEYNNAPSYVMNDLGPQPFAGGGTPMDASADEATWDIALPFPFPFFDGIHDVVYITPNGCVDLAPLWNESLNTTNFLRGLPRIAALWDDLKVTGSDDIYITSTASSVRFRWDAGDGRSR